MEVSLRVPKDKDIDKWGKETMQFYFGKGLITGDMKREMEVLYNLASGYLDERDYSYVLNPLGEEQRKRPELQGDTAKMRNYDIISPVINSYLGDFVERGTKFQAVDPNYDIEEVRRDYEAKLRFENLLSQFREELKNKSGVDTEMDNSQMPEEEISRKVEQLPDTDVIKGQKALDYIRYRNELDRLYRLAYYDYVTVGRPFTYRDAFMDDTYFDVVNPLDFNYYGSPDTVFVEDCESAWVEYKWTASEIIDKLDDILSDDARDYINREYGTSLSQETSIGFSFSDMLMDDGLQTLMRNLSGRVRADQTGLVVRHQVWKARVKLGKLIQYDEFDNEVGYIEVDEDFIPRKGETVLWQDAHEVWEGYCLNDEYYFGINRVPLQSASLSNPAKLPYNGVTYGNRTALPNTPVKIGKQFTELHNIVKYRIERSLAKNKDKITPFPLGAINDEKMDMFQTMYYSEYHGWLFYDETDPKVLQGLTQARALDLSLNQYIKAMYELSYQIRQEYYETIGLPRQKLANIMASDDVGNTQEAINRSNLLSEDMLIKFEELQEKDYQYLINISKYIWVNGKKDKFKNADNEIDDINLDESYAATPHIVFVKGTKEERRKLEALRAQVQPFAQNGYGPVAIGEIIGATNYQQLMHKLDFYERQLQERQQQQQQAAAQTEQMKQEEENAREEARLEFDYYKVDTDNETKKLIKAMELQGAALNIMLSGDSSAQMEATKVLDAATKEIQALNIKREELAVKREESKDKVKIAETNKNQYDFKSK